MSNLRECLIVWPEDELEENKDNILWNVLAFDGVMEEGHSGTSAVTSYPIDRGFLISDSVIKHNRKITLNTITSNVSYKVSVKRKSFDESFTELMTSIQMSKTQEPLRPEGLDKLLNLVGMFNDGTVSEYPKAVKHGRAAYDNDSFFNPTRGGLLDRANNATGGFLGNALNTVGSALAAQVESRKVDEVVRLIDDLNASGTRVHVITMRGVRSDCVITGYAMVNNNQNALNANIDIELTQMTVAKIQSDGSILTSNTTNSSEGAEALRAEQRVTTPTVFLGSPSPMSYFAAGFAFRAMPLSERDIAQNPVRLGKDRVKLGDKMYFDTDYQEIKISDKRDFYLSYKGVDYTFGKIKFNDALNKFTTSLSWRKDGVQKNVGLLPLTVGTNLVSQYGTNFESLVAVNLESPGDNIKELKHLKLIIVSNYEEYYL